MQTITTATPPCFHRVVSLFVRRPARIVERMIRSAVLIPLAILVTGCAVNGQSLGYRPKPMTDRQQEAAIFRAEAEYQATGKVQDDRLAHVDPHARIKIQPSPGKETIYGEGNEVLTSMPSGGYFAFISQVPPTQYFRIVRRADCDEWGMIFEVNPQMLKNNPELTIQSRKYHGDKPVFQCLAAFDGYYANKDHRLDGADGVVFDIDSTKVDKGALHWSLLTNKVKIHIDGWAIQFGDPSPEEIRKRIAYYPSQHSPIDLLQFRSAVFWIEKNRALEYVAPLIALLPSVDQRGSPLHWTVEGELVLRTLARLAPDTLPLDFWMGVIEKGRTPGVNIQRPGASDVRATPLIAANVVVCRNDDRKALTERFVSVINGPYPFTHKQAAAKALRTLGQGSAIFDHADFRGQPIIKAVSGTTVFTCPYSSGVDAT